MKMIQLRVFESVGTANDTPTTLKIKTKDRDPQVCNVQESAGKMSTKGNSGPKHELTPLSRVSIHDNTVIPLLSAS
jgi:hypothetical protein